MGSNRGLATSAFAPQSPKAVKAQRFAFWHGGFVEFVDLGAGCTAEHSRPEGPHGLSCWSGLNSRQNLPPVRGSLL